MLNSVLNLENFYKQQRKRTLRHDHPYCQVVPIWSALRDHKYCRFFAFKSKYFIKFKDLSFHKFDCNAQLYKYSCNHCKFKTHFVVSLAQHFLDFHNSDLIHRHNSYYLEKIYACDGCGFQTHSLLVWLKHETVKCTKKTVLKCVYCCNRCFFTCGSLLQLETHQLYRHLTLSFPSYEKYKCDICTFTAVSESGLRTHKSVTHQIRKVKTGKKRKFNNHKPKLIMKRHLAKDPVASVIQWYKCASCNFKSQQSANVKTHVCLEKNHLCS